MVAVHASPDRRQHRRLAVGLYFAPCRFCKLRIGETPERGTAAALGRYRDDPRGPGGEGTNCLKVLPQKPTRPPIATAARRGHTGGGVRHRANAAAAAANLFVQVVKWRALNTSGKPTPLTRCFAEHLSKRAGTERTSRGSCGRKTLRRRRRKLSFSLGTNVTWSASAVTIGARWMCCTMPMLNQRLRPKMKVCSWVAACLVGCWRTQSVSQSPPPPSSNARAAVPR